MTSGTAHLRILEEDHGVDAVTLEKVEEGITYLFVRPGQSFESAVNSILRVCPELSRSEAQELVRDHCPHIIEMNERLGVDQALPRFEAAPDAGAVAPAPAPVKDAAAHRRPRPPRWARIAAVAAPALVGGALLANWLQPAGTQSAAPPAASPTLSQDDKVAAGTYRNPDFEKIADGGQMKCDPMGAYEAKCVDADGKVMSSEASVGTSTAFTFSYDYEKIGFRVFPDTEGASAWAAEEANKDLYQNVSQHGRIVLWGTDAKRLGEWERSVVAEGQTPARHANPVSYSEPMGPNSPLPERLATLAFGTLGVTEEVVEAAVQSDDVESVQLLRAVQLVLGSAEGSQLGLTPSGANDAVAVVADATDRPEANRTSAQGEVGDELNTVAPVEPPVEPSPQPVVQNPAPTEAPAESGTDEVAPKPPVATPEPKPAEPQPDPVPTPAEKPTVHLPPEEKPTDHPAPSEEAPQPPAEEQPVVTEPEEPAEEHPAAPAEPETPPAPPVMEEPEEDGLGLEGLPGAWAAA
ncbi:hypothetical protein [Streptomyces microflavus]|uniref:hypothetical protein n=1 Tax=Streptomyces microflavus TaxID=1919 RepID=UPI0033D64335